MKRTSIKLRCYLPPIQSAISLSGNGDGARIKLDVPEQFRAQVAALAALTEVELEAEFTVVVDEGRR